MVTNNARRRPELLNDKDWSTRKKYWRNVGGSPGWVIGGGFGLMGLVAVAASRVGYHSGAAFTRAAIMGTNYALDPKEKFDAGTKDQRSLTWEELFSKAELLTWERLGGAPGWVVW